MDERYTKILRAARQDSSLRDSLMREGQRSGNFPELIAFPFRELVDQETGSYSNREWSLLYPCTYNIGEELRDIQDKLYQWCLDPSSVPQWLVERFGHFEENNLTSLGYPFPGVGLLHMDIRDDISETRLERIVRESDPFPNLEAFCQDVYSDTTHALVLTKPVLDFIYPLLRRMWNQMYNVLHDIDMDLHLIDGPAWENLYDILLDYSLLAVDASGVQWLDPPHPISVNGLLG